VRTVKKILMVALVVIITMAAALSILVATRHNQLAEALIKKVNNTINTKISYESLSVGFWGSFPDISVKFYNILLKPSDGYSTEEFVTMNNDTLLFASTMAVSVDLRSFITGQTIITGISCKNGNINLLTDSKGNTNFRVINRDPEKEPDSKIKLNLIAAKDMSIIYDDHTADVLIKGDITNSAVSGEIFGTGIDLTARVSATLDLLEVYGFSFANRKAEAELSLFKTKSSVSFRKGKVKLGDLLCNITGSVDYEHKWLELKINGSNIDLSDMVARLPQQYSKAFEGIKPGGNVELSGDINGYYSNGKAPHFDFQYNLSRGRLIYDQSGIDVNNLYLKGIITNGSKNNRKTFRLTVDTLKAALGAAYFNGNLTIENLINPYIDLTLNGDLVFDDLRKLIRTKSFDSREGAVSGNISLKGRLPEGVKPDLKALPYLNPVANISLESFAADLPEAGLFFRDVSGKIRLTEHLRTEDLFMTILNQKYCFNCDFGNFIGWLAGNGETLEITGSVSAETFDPSAFASVQREKPSNEDEERPVTLFPSDVRAMISFHAQKLTNKKFNAEDFSCNLTYKPFVLSFNDISARCLDGSVSGDFMIGLKSDGSYISRSSLVMNNLDIRKAFVSFNDFGQKFIVSDNLGGRLSGNLTLLTMTDRDFNVLKPTIIAETHISVTDGRLINFKPVEELSSFIDLNELKEISFSKMENDLFVKNSILSIPKMQITSSVGSFSVYGTHSFSDEYSYHIRVKLSEVLSHKARERNRNRSEFGKVEEDETGRLSIPLKLENKKGKPDVNYDFGQSKDIVKESITEEKKNLKNILNEEYGWYKKDSTIVEKTTTETKPKFNVTWEEGKEETTTQEEKEEETKPLFRKNR